MPDSSTPLIAPPSPSRRTIASAARQAVVIPRISAADPGAALIAYLVMVLTSASLPLQLERAVQKGRVERGSLVALVGLAGGISVGTMVLRW